MASSSCGIASGPKMFSGGMSKVTRQKAGACLVRRTRAAVTASVIWAPRSVGEYAGALHRRRDELEVDETVMARKMIGIVGTAFDNGGYQLFVFAQGAQFHV